MGRTSTEVKRRYNDKTYSHINVAVPKELAAAFKRACAERGVSQAQVLQEAMTRFVYGVGILTQKERLVEMADLALHGGLKSGDALRDDDHRHFATQTIRRIMKSEFLGVCADGEIDVFMHERDSDFNTIGYRIDYGLAHKGECCSAAEMEERITAFIEELLAEIRKEADGESSN